MKFHNVYLDNGLFTLINDVSDSSRIEFVPQLFVRSSNNGKEFLEITYYGQCVDESVEERTTYFDYCRIGMLNYCNIYYTFIFTKFVQMMCR